VCLVLGIGGCGGGSSSVEGGRAESGIAIVDDLGRTIVIPSPADRIVSLAPACTEILFAVGAGDRVVGVTTFDNYPPEVASITKVGGFSRETINVEQLVALEPDFVLSSGSLQRDLIDELARLDIVTVAIEPQSLDDVLRHIRLVGRITGEASRAERVASRIADDLERIRSRFASKGPAERPRVFYQVWDRPLRTAGAASFIGHLIEAAGGRNLFGTIQEAYPLVSEESLIEADPQVIFLPRREGQDLDQLFARPGFERIEAIRSRRIHAIDEDLVSRPGPRIAEAVEAMAARLHEGGVSEGRGTGRLP